MESTTIKIGRAADAMAEALNTPGVRVYYRSLTYGLVLVNEVSGECQRKACEVMSVLILDAVVASEGGVSQIGSKVTVHVPRSGEVSIVYGGRHPEDDLAVFEPYAIPAQAARHYDLHNVAVYYAGSYANVAVEYQSTRYDYTYVRSLDGVAQTYALYESTELVVAPIEEINNA